METTCKIIKREKGKTNHKLGVHSLKINNTIMDNPIMIAITFNRFFISVAHAIISNVKSGNNIHGNTNPANYLFNSFRHPFPNIQWFNTSSGEVGTIMK